MTRGNTMNNETENFMKWALELANQEYNGNVKDLTTVMESYNG